MKLQDIREIQHLQLIGFQIKSKQHIVFIDEKHLFLGLLRCLRFFFLIRN